MKDYVLFEMPRDRERQFVAMSVVQNYLHTYEDRHKLPNTPAELADTELYYRVNMTPEDWAFFSQIGLKLRYRQKYFDEPDMVIELTDEKAKTFEDVNPKRHLAEIYGIMSGVPCRAIPIVTLVRSCPYMDRWATLDDAPYTGFYELTSQQLVTVPHQLITGVIGYQSWGTFLAAAMQLPVIEILPKGRNRYRLTKWDHPYYRLVEESKGDVEFQIEQAKANLALALQDKKEADTRQPVLVTQDTL